MMRWLAISLAIVSIAAAACDLDLERMTDQPRFTAYEECAVCPQGTIMMQPPDGTVHRGQPLPGPAIALGRIGEAWVTDVPIFVDRAVLHRGRNRFDIFCAACHGRLGNGVSQVGENMALREPPSLIRPPASEFPVGRIYAAITDGYGLMRSYANELPVEERWAVVAYVEALQLSQRMRVDELPPALRKEASSWLR
jgi:mono/diheme cytochrome c family protein